MQPKTSSSAGWLLVILVNLLIHLATALPPRASGLRAYRDESDDGAVREESVRHLDPIDGVHHFESEQELNDFLRQMEERAKNTNGKWMVEYKRYSSHSNGAAGGGADGDVQTHIVDGYSSLLNGASTIQCKRCTLKIRRVKNGELVSGGGESFIAGSTKTASSNEGRASMTGDDLLRNYGEVGGLNRGSGEFNRNVKVTKFLTTSTSGAGSYGSGGSMTIGDLMRNYGSTGEHGGAGSGNVKVTKVVTSNTNIENGEEFNAEEALARADEILRKYQNGENVFGSAGENSRHAKVTKTVTSENSGSYGQGGSDLFTRGQVGSYGNSGGYGGGSRIVKITKTTGSGSLGSFGAGRYINSGAEDVPDILGNANGVSGGDSYRNVKVTRITTDSTTGRGYGGGYRKTGSGGSYGSREVDDLLKTNDGSSGNVQDVYRGTSGYNSGILTQNQGSGTYGASGNTGWSRTEKNSGTTRKSVKITKSYWSGNTELGSLGDDTENFDELKRRLQELINSGGFRNGKTVTTVTTSTSTNGGPPVVKTERYIKDGIDLNLNMDSLGTLDTAHNSIYGSQQSHVLTSGANNRDVDYVGGEGTKTTRKTVKITKSYWKGNTQLGNFDGTSGHIDEDLRRRLEELRRNGEYENGKTVTTVTTTTSVDGGPPEVKTERYVKDGYDLSLDMKSLGSLDTAENSIYGQSHQSTFNQGISGGLQDNLSRKTTKTTRKTVKITKSYWKGDTQLGSFDGTSGPIDEDLRRRLEELRRNGEYENGKTVTTVTTTTSVDGGPPEVKTERYVKDGYDLSLDMKSLGSLDTAENSIYGQSHQSTFNQGISGGLQDNYSRKTTKTTRKTVKITKSYWKGDTQLGNFDGTSGHIDEDLRRRLEELRRNGENVNGKTVTTVTTTTSVDGGPPEVKTERYVKDGYDLSLDMKSLGSLDTAENSIYGQSHQSTSNQGISGGSQDNYGEKTTKTRRKSVKISKSFWKGDTQLGICDGDSGQIDEDLRKKLEELRRNGEYENGKTVTTVTTTTSVDSGPPIVKTERYVKDGFDLSLDMDSLGSLDTAEDSVYGQSYQTTLNHGSIGGLQDNLSGKTTKTTRKTVKITKSYWKGDTQLGSFDGTSGPIDEDLRRRLEELRRNGEYENGKTVTTVTTTTSVDGGPPEVKTERYVKDGYDLSLDMKSLGSLDIAENSIYGQSHQSTFNGGIGSGVLDNHSGETRKTTRKSVEITKTYWKGDTQLGSVDVVSGDINEDLRRKIEELRRKGEFENGKTVTTVTTTTSVNGGPPEVKRERYVKDGYDLSLDMKSLGALDTAENSIYGQSQSATSNHGTSGSWQDNLGVEMVKTTRKNVKITKTFLKGNAQLGSFSGDIRDENLKKRIESFKNDGDYVDGRTVTTVTTTTSTNGGPPLIKTERYIKDGFDTSLTMDSFGTLDTSFNSGIDNSQVLTSSHDNQNIKLDHIGDNVSESSRKTVKITKTYWKGSTELGSLSDADHTSSDLSRKLEELIRKGDMQDGKTVTTVTTTTYTNGGTPVVKTERYVKDGIDTSLHSDSFGSLDTSFGSTSDHSYSLSSSHSSETDLHGAGIGRPLPGGARTVGTSYGSTVHQGSTIADQMNSNEFRTVVVGGEIQPDRDERPTVIEAMPAGPARHARPVVPMSPSRGSGYGSGSAQFTHTSSIYEGGSGVTQPINPVLTGSNPFGSGSTYKKTVVSTHKTSQSSGSMNVHEQDLPLINGGSRVITATDDSAKTAEHNAGQGSSSHSVSIYEGNYGHDSSGRFSGSDHDLPFSSNSNPAEVEDVHYTRPGGVPVVTGSYFKSGRKTSESLTPESSVLQGVSHEGPTRTTGQNVVSSSTYTKHADSSSTGIYRGSSTSQSSAERSSSEEDEGYHGPYPTPSPSIKIGYGTGVGGYGGGSTRVVSGSYSQTAGSSYGGSSYGQGGYNSGVKTVSPSSGYSSGSSYSSDSVGSGSSYIPSGSYGRSMSTYGIKGTSGSSALNGNLGPYVALGGHSYGIGSSSTVSGSRKVTSYGADDCVEAVGPCRQSSEEGSMGSVQKSPSYSYSQSWSSRNTHGGSLGSGIKGGTRSERISQNENEDCEEAY